MRGLFNLSLTSFVMIWTVAFEYLFVWILTYYVPPAHYPVLSACARLLYSVYTLKSMHWHLFMPTNIPREPMASCPQATLHCRKTTLGVVHRAARAKMAAELHPRSGKLIGLSNSNRTAQRNQPVQEFNHGLVPQSGATAGSRCLHCPHRQEGKQACPTRERGRERNREKGGSVCQIVCSGSLTAYS